MDHGNDHPKKEGHRVKPVKGRVNRTIGIGCEMPWEMKATVKPKTLTPRHVLRWVRDVDATREHLRKSHNASHHSSPDNGEKHLAPLSLFLADRLNSDSY